MKHVIFGFLAFSTLLFSEQKVGLVDLERVIMSTSDGKEAKLSLESEFKNKQELLDKKQAELQKKQMDLQNQAAVMTNEAKQKKAMELQSEFAEAQQMFGSMQQDFARRQQEEMGNILGKTKPIVSDLAKKEKYNLVLNKTDATVLYSDGSADLTNEVIKRYEAAHPPAKKPAKK